MGNILKVLTSITKQLKICHNKNLFIANFKHGRTAIAKDCMKCHGKIKIGDLVVARSVYVVREYYHYHCAEELKVITDKDINIEKLSSAVRHRYLLEQNQRLQLPT